MTRLTVTERGEVTLDENTLEHLGIRPGGKIVLDLLPGRRAELRADKQPASWEDLRGFFVGKTNGTKLTIDQINDAIASAGAEAGMSGLKKR